MNLSYVFQMFQNLCKSCMREWSQVVIHLRKCKITIVFINISYVNNHSTDNFLKSGNSFHLCDLQLCVPNNFCCNTVSFVLNKKLHQIASRQYHFLNAERKLSIVLRICACTNMCRELNIRQFESFGYIMQKVN